MTDTSDAAADPADDLHCPICDYALRGLPHPRCPECGYAFEWAELRECQRLKQGWFYEHAGTLWSHLRTRWRSLRPWSFWAQIHAYTEADPRRLWRYRATTLAIGLLIWAGIAGLFILRDLTLHAVWMAYHSPPTAFSLTPPANGIYHQYPPALLGGIPVKLRPPGMSVTSTQPVYYYTAPPPWWATWLWPLMSLNIPFLARRVVIVVVMTIVVQLALPLYWRLLRGSVVQAAVRPTHLARVDAYSTDALPLLLVLAFAVEMVTPFALGMVFDDRTFWTTLAAAMTPVLVVVGGLTLRLRSALRWYVRFPHAGGVAIGYGVIAALAWLVVSLQSGTLLRF